MEHGERDLLQEQGPIIPLRFSYAVEHPGGDVVEWRKRNRWRLRSFRK